MYKRQILEFSRYAFNAVSKTEKYQVEPINGNLLDNLPEFELEELVIDYIQLKYNYYPVSYTHLDVYKRQIIICFQILLRTSLRLLRLSVSFVQEIFYTQVVRWFR